jgi:hypothetical protein
VCGGTLRTSSDGPLYGAGDSRSYVKFTPAGAELFA